MRPVEERVWSGEEFQAFCKTFYRGAYGWQSALARQLNVSVTTIQRWTQDGVPDRVRDRLQRLAGE